MIYLDSSVALAALLAESRAPPASLWQEELISSRLLQFEVVNRLAAYGVDSTGMVKAHQLLSGVALVELSPLVLARALEPFSPRVRTLDALHLATAHYLDQQRVPITLATYDRRMAVAARSLGLASIEPD